MKRLWSLALVFVFSAVAFAHPPTGKSEAPSKAKPKHVTDFYELVDWSYLQKALSGTGISGRIHGAVPELNQYIIVLGQDLAAAVELPIYTHDPKVAEQMKKLHRNDLVTIKGKVVKRSPINHLAVTALEVNEPFKTTFSGPHEKVEAKLPPELVDGSEIIATIHAAPRHGKVLVLDYKGRVLPLFLPEEGYDLTNEICRGDKVRIQYFYREMPEGVPPHLELDLSAQNPIDDFDKMLDQDEREVELEGLLTLHERNPVVTVDVFGLQVTDKLGLTRIYFIMNFDPEVRGKLQKLWEENRGSLIVGRNLEYNPKIRLKITGTVSSIRMFSSRQGNPQLYFDSWQAVTVLPTK
jgi:hypothetical protein